MQRKKRLDSLKKNCKFQYYIPLNECNLRIGQNFKNSNETKWGKICFILLVSLTFCIPLVYVWNY